MALVALLCWISPQSTVEAQCLFRDGAHRTPRAALIPGARIVSTRVVDLDGDRVADQILWVRPPRARYTDSYCIYLLHARDGWHAYQGFDFHTRNSCPRGIVPFRGRALLFDLTLSEEASCRTCYALLAMESDGSMRVLAEIDSGTSLIRTFQESPDRSGLIAIAEDGRTLALQWDDTAGEFRLGQWTEPSQRQPGSPAPHGNGN